MRSVLLSSLLVLSPALVLSQSAERASLARDMDSIIVAEMNLRKWPSVTAFIVRGNDTILAKAYGQADIELGVPARIDGVYWIGSVTKQMVASAILRLAERGVLSLDDSIGKWVPELPEWWRGVGMRELLWHTSGIPSYTGQLRSAFALVRPFGTADSALALARDIPPDFARGTQMLYNNTGYVLLGRVLEVISGKPLGAAMRDELFTPLEIDELSYCDVQSLVPGRVGGYQRVGSQVRRAVLWWPDMAHGAGALCGTVGGLMAWSQALHGGRVLTGNRYAQMIAPGRLADGSELRYGMGLMRVDVAGRRALQHSGGISGFTTWLAYLPDDSLHIAMTVNLFVPTERPSLAGVKLVERILGRRSAPTGVSLSATTRDAVTGTYGTAPLTAVVRRDSDELILWSPGAAPRALVYRGFSEGAERFVAADGALVAFVRRGEGGPVHQVRVDGGSSYLVMDRK